LAESRGLRLVLLRDRIVTAFSDAATPPRAEAGNLLRISPPVSQWPGCRGLTWLEQRKNIVCNAPPLDTAMTSGPSSSSKPNPEDTDELELAVEQAIAACGGDLRAAIRALILANDFLENEVSELMKAVSHAYVRGRFQSYSG
jgi:hypothetical protein